jgi:Anthrone oxygenase
MLSGSIFAPALSGSGILIPLPRVFVSQFLEARCRNFLLETPRSRRPNRGRLGRYLRSRLANWPYTVVVITPTKRRLMNTPAGVATAETRRMIERWGVLHAGRSALGVIATLIFLRAVKSRPPIFEFS